MNTEENKSNNQRHWCSEKCGCANKPNNKVKEMLDKLELIFGEYEASDYQETTKMEQDVMELFVKALT